MKSRILFLGTGGDIFVVGKQYRASGGIIFTIDDNQFHVDPGPGAIVMAKMMGLNLRLNTCILISKNNLFSTNDVNAVISAMTHDGLDKRGVIVCPSEAVHDSDKKISPFLNKYYRECLEKIITTDNTKKISINDIDIKIVRLKDAYGYKFLTKKFNLGYLPDTAYSDDTGSLYKDCDILIVSVLDPRNIERENHLNMLYVEKIIGKARPQLAVITGFGIKMLEAEPLYEARELQKATGIQVIAAKDGMTINPVSFAATVRQRKLKA